MEKKSENIKSDSFITKLILGLNSMVIILLLISYSAIFCNPNTLWIIAFFGLAYPFIMSANLVFIAIWLLIRPKYALYSAFFILIGFSQVSSFYQFSGETKPDDSKDSLKVMSFNVRLFDLYNYNKNWTYNFEGRNQIFNFLRQEQPDVVCFQEYFHNSTNEFCTTDSLKAILKTDQLYTYYPQVLRKTDFYGIAIFSKYPIVNAGVVAFLPKTYNSAIYIDILKGDQTLRIYNAHLQSIRFGKEDYVFSDDVQQAKSKGIDINKSSKKIISKMKQAYLLRAKQAMDLKKHISKSPHPVILCGDFNDTPTSFSYHTLSQNLTDCFKESGEGFGRTYSGKMPSFRIDYIFHDDHFDGYEFTTHQELKSSDHYPITVILTHKK